jgi:hypothetical protein
VIAGDAQPLRLDADAIGCGGDTGGGQTADGTKESASRDHAEPLVMPYLNVPRLKRNWGALVQIIGRKR